MRPALLAPVVSVLALVAALHATTSDLTLAPVFGDHMVLQQRAPVPVWGTASAGETIAVTFANQRRTTRADAAGAWRVVLDPLRASAEPQTLTVAASSTLRVTDVLVGEVWLAAGQSNMEWTLAKEMHAETELPQADAAGLRLLNLPFAGQYFYATPFGPAELARMTPARFYSGAWQASSPASARDFSAIAWYFGRAVQADLGVPVGVIHLAVGGSPAEAWIRRAALAGDSELGAMARGNWLANPALDDWCRERGHQNLDAPIASGQPVPGDDLGPNHHFKPGFLWEAGPARLLPFAVRGVLWYQGESNALEPRRVAQHERLFPLLVADWRAQWGQRRLPFLYCQLSAIGTDGGYHSSAWPDFRDQQRRMLATIPDTAMAVTSDIGDPTDVHPRNKRDVGRRLALAALAEVYGRGVEFSGPRVDRAERQGDRVIVRFQHAAGLTTTDGQPPNGFEVAGESGEFFPAAAAIEQNRIVLTCPRAARPVQVRYLWQPYPRPTQNLVNAARLPASTFRIDIGAGRR